MAFDFKKEYKEYYMPKNRPGIVTVPNMNYIAVRGQGDPNTEDGEYKQAIGLLYGIAFTIKMSKKGEHHIDGYFDYVVPPLEGFWWQDGVDGIDYAHKENFKWVSVIRLPDFVTKEDFEWAVEEATKKKKTDFSKVETRVNVFSVCTSAHMTMNLPLSLLCTSIWRSRGMFSILRISVCIMKSISAMQERLLQRNAKL